MASQLAEQGFVLVPNLCEMDDIRALQMQADEILGNSNQSGVRNLLQRSPLISTLAQSPQLLSLVAQLVGDGARCVRAILFDKRPDTNWKVAWHQDLAIAVKSRRDVHGYGPWSVKDGVPHVQPPVAVLEAMLTARIHLDDCDENNGPLRVIPGSHQFGVLAAGAIRDHKSSNPTACLCKSGDAILIKPLLLHASSKALRPRRRRVVHLEFAACEPANGLEWFVS